MSSYYVDIHVLQSVPPSNVNRDDTGSPKSALYGGVRRARVSSQAWKKAVRTSFKDFLPASQTGARTLRAVELLMNRLTADPYRLAQEDARQKALAVVKALGLKADKPRVKEGSGPEGVERTQYLVFYSNQQLDRPRRARSPVPTPRRPPIPIMGSRSRCSVAWSPIPSASTSTRPCRSPTR